MQQADLKARMRIYDFLFLTENAIPFLSWRKVSQNQEGNYFIPGYLNSI